MSIAFEQQDGGALPILKLSIMEEEIELGFYFFIPHSTEMYEVHTHFYPESYGSALPITSEAMQYIFKELPMMNTLVTKVPITNPLAKRLCTKVGMKYCGTIPNSFEGVAQEMFYISRGDV